MDSYQVVDVAYGTEQYEKTISLRDKVMREPLGLRMRDEDLSYEKDAVILAVFNSEGEILGTGIYVIKDKETAKLRFLCVDSSLQKGGVGKAILGEVERRLKEQGIGKLGMDARYTAMGFYQKMGYQESGEPYLLEYVPIDHIWMEKQL